MLFSDCNSVTLYHLHSLSCLLNYLVVSSGCVRVALLVLKQCLTEYIQQGGTTTELKNLGNLNVQLMQPARDLCLSVNFVVSKLYLSENETKTEIKCQCNKCLCA